MILNREGFAHHGLGSQKIGALLPDLRRHARWDARQIEGEGTWCGHLASTDQPNQTQTGIFLQAHEFVHAAFQIFQ